MLAYLASTKLLRSSIMMASGSSSKRCRLAAIFCRSAAVDKYLPACMHAEHLITHPHMSASSRCRE